MTAVVAETGFVVTSAPDSGPLPPEVGCGANSVPPGAVGEAGPGRVGPLGPVGERVGGGAPTGSGVERVVVVVAVLAAFFW